MNVCYEQANSLQADIERKHFATQDSITSCWWSFLVFRPRRWWYSTSFWKELSGHFCTFNRPDFLVWCYRNKVEGQRDICLSQRWMTKFPLWTQHWTNRHTESQRGERTHFPACLTFRRVIPRLCPNYVSSESCNLFTSCSLEEYFSHERREQALLFLCLQCWVCEHGSTSPSGVINRQDSFQHTAGYKKLWTIHCVPHTSILSYSFCRVNKRRHNKDRDLPLTAHLIRPAWLFSCKILLACALLTEIV